MTPLRKYPRTYHFDWSPNLQNDDRRMPANGMKNDKTVVATLKMDGENTTMLKSTHHARSLSSPLHPSRSYIHALWNSIRHDIPDDLRICGENLQAEHSIRYENLPNWFMVFGIWRGDYCLNWRETVEWCELLGLQTVPVFYMGPFDQEAIHTAYENLPGHEGYVVRTQHLIPINRWHVLAGKYVRKGHVQTDEHWMNKAMVENGRNPNGPLLSLMQGSTSPMIPY